MNSNEPVYQDGSSGICEVPGQVSVGLSVPRLSPLQGENRTGGRH